MNDEYQRDDSMNGWSSGSDVASTATAEPVDRRWFEEALRAQGFLVEPPALEDEDAWPGTPDAEAPDQEPLPLDIDLDLDPDLDDDPLAAGPDPGQTADQAVAEASPVFVAEAERAAASAPDDQSTPFMWPVIGATPARLGATPVPTATVAPAASVTRQAVAPTTLPDGRLPVPTGALAARLSRGARTTAAVAPETLVTDEAVAAPATLSEPELGTIVAEVAAQAYPTDLVVAPALVETSTPGRTEAPPESISRSWTLPALKADLAAERANGTSLLDDAPVPFVVAAAAAVAEPVAAVPEPAEQTLAVAEPAEQTLAVAEPAEQTLAVAEPAEQILAVAEPAEQILAVAEPAEQILAVAEPDEQILAVDLAVAAAQDAPPPNVGMTITPVEAVMDPVADAAPETASEPGAPQVATLTGIAAIAPRPPAAVAAAVVAPSIDTADSDLWGLVGDADQAASAMVPVSATRRSSRILSALLTVFVAIVVVVLVLGFIYLFTNLL